MKAMLQVRTWVTTLLFSAFVAAASAFTAADAENILFMKQEEKLARDVYRVLYEKWGHVTFKNIVVSEQQHMDAIDTLIARYRLDDETPAEAGEFTYPELQALYDELVAQGSESLEAALEVGVLIEKTDIEDLEAALAVAKDRPIKNVFGNLLLASKNHLVAFTRALAVLP